VFYSNGLAFRKSTNLGEYGSETALA
jgi:hypothetical protein